MWAFLSLRMCGRDFECAADFFECPVFLDIMIAGMSGYARFFSNVQFFPVESPLVCWTFGFLVAALSADRPDNPGHLVYGHRQAPLRRPLA